jgi:hypothetical protein
VQNAKHGPASLLALDSSFITHHSSLKSWHVIPRFRDDPHFPNPIWGARMRQAAPRSIDPAAVKRLLAARLAKLAASQVAGPKT